MKPTNRHKENNSFQNQHNHDPCGIMTKTKHPKSKVSTMYGKLIIFGLVFAWTMNFARPASAYLDPGTGSIILQLLLGGIAGGLVLAKLYWQRIRNFFTHAEKRANKNIKHGKD